MFSKQIKAIFRVLGNAFLTLASMTEEDAEHLEMTGRQYIDHLDRPDVGADIPVDTSKHAATVFGAAGGGTSANAGQTAAVFVATGEFVAPPAEVTLPVVVAKSEPVYTMTAAAGAYSREDYHASNWTDDALIESGFMTVEYPNALPAAASTSPPAPSAPQPVSTPAAPPAAPANTDAPVPAGGATVDSTGLPWDVRIHSGTRTQTKDGAWTKKRGTGDAYYNQVVAELRQATPAPAPVPFQPLSAPAPAAPAAAKPATFAELCKWVTANGFTVPDMVATAAQFGIDSAGVLAQPINGEIIPMVYDKMVASLK